MAQIETGEVRKNKTDFFTVIVERFIPKVFVTMCTGFACVTFSMMLARQGIENLASASSARQYIGMAMYLSTLIFFFAVGLFRLFQESGRIKPIPYRILHFGLTTIAFYLCFFMLLPELSISLGEVADDFGSTGVNWRNVIFSYTIFLFFYFVVVGGAAIIRSIKAKRLAQNQDYQKMVEQGRNK